MALVTDAHFRLALTNVSHLGDTDIFPFPLENLVFFDDVPGTLEVLRTIDKEYSSIVDRYPLLAVKSLTAVGYSGFRWGTQIDPIWNVYLLSLVLTIGSEIESKRVAIDKGTVFSYRYAPDVSTGQIFDRTVGWVAFQERSVDLARQFPFVLTCDISDFYPRVYHHRLENALKKASGNSEAILRIKDLLFRISEGVSYGLPVGGPASRLLSEILLNRIDRLLVAERVVYCRFVDDFHIFAKSREDAYRQLILLSELLLANEGLSLQKTKTRILSSEEFLSTSDFAIENKPDSKEAEEARAFTRIRLRYDPYSPTADDDYAELKNELSKFDIVGMLGRQLTKSRVDEGLTRRLLSAVKHLPPESQDKTVASLVASLDVLYPVLPAVMILCKGLIETLESKTKDEVFRVIRDLISSDSYLMQVPTHLAFSLRVLAFDDSEETEAILAKLYRMNLNMMLKRDIILLMGYRGADHWISNCRKQFSTLTLWEKRALIVCSYLLEDEGKHWRDGIKKELSDFDRLVLKWAGDKKNTLGAAWRVPL